jgi:pimeloyl-ACP methyl ester carboxylesterase
MRPSRPSRSIRPQTDFVTASLMISALMGGCAQQGDSRKSGYAPVNGLRMYYEVHGRAAGDEPPLVLLHGGGSTIDTTFERILPLLARTRRVIAFEQQGHGRTADLADRPFTFEQSADDTAALLDQLEVQRADLLGFSNGGSIALQVAIRHPERVRKLAVASAMFKRDGMEAQFWEFMKHATLNDMPEALKAAYRSTAPNPEQLQLFHDKSVKRMLEFKDWPPEAIRSIAAPTLVLSGDHDVVRPEHAVEMFRLIPRARLAVLPGAHGEFIGEVSAVKIQGPGISASRPIASALPEMTVKMIEEFLDAPLEGRG